MGTVDDRSLGRKVAPLTGLSDHVRARSAQFSWPYSGSPFSINRIKLQTPYRTPPPTIRPNNAAVQYIIRPCSRRSKPRGRFTPPRRNPPARPAAREPHARVGTLFQRRPKYAPSPTCREPSIDPKERYWENRVAEATPPKDWIRDPPIPIRGQPVRLSPLPFQRVYAESRLT